MYGAANIVDSYFSGSGWNGVLRSGDFFFGSSGFWGVLGISSDGTERWVLNLYGDAFGDFFVIPEARLAQI